MNPQLFSKLLEVLETSNEREFNFSGYGFNDDEVEQISHKISHVPYSIKLNLSDNDIGPKGVESLAVNPRISALDLSNNHIGQEGAKILAQNTTIKELDVSQNEIGDEGAKALAENRSVEKLTATYCNIGDEGGIALFQNNSLEVLNIGGNGIGEAGAKAIAENKTLKELNISENEIGDEGAKALSKNTTLEKLIIINCNIGKEGLELLDSAKTTFGIIFSDIIDFPKLHSNTLGDSDYDMTPSEEDEEEWNSTFNSKKALEKKIINYINFLEAKPYWYPSEEQLTNKEESDVAKCEETMAASLLWASHRWINASVDDMLCDVLSFGIDNDNYIQFLGDSL